MIVTRNCKLEEIMFTWFYNFVIGIIIIWLEIGKKEKKKRKKKKQEGSFLMG